MFKVFKKSTVSITKMSYTCCLLNIMFELSKMTSILLDTPTPKWKSLRYCATPLLTPFIATFDTRHLQIEPTLIGRITPSNFNNNVKGAKATNSSKLIMHLPLRYILITRVMAHRRSFATITFSTHKKSNMCWACKSSLLNDVPLGHNLIYVFNFQNLHYIFIIENHSGLSQQLLLWSGLQQYFEGIAWC